MPIPTLVSRREPIADRVNRYMPGRLPQPLMISLLASAIPLLHDMGKEAHVEAVSEALSRLDWAHLGTAPRDGTTILVAFEGDGDWPEYISLARWIIPEAGEPLNTRKEHMLARFGGWWGSGRGKPHRTRALAWLPLPALPGGPVLADRDAPSSCADDEGVFSQVEAA